MSSRQQLSQREIDAVLAHYDIGTVHAIHELAEGSLYSPKTIVECDRGKLLLKRRARGLDIPAVVAFSHEIMLACLERGLCIPPLLGTKDEHNSMVQFEDQAYELFVFIEGSRYAHTPEFLIPHAQQAGALLGELHTILDTLTAQNISFEAPVEPTTIDIGRLPVLQSPVCAGMDPKLRDELARLLTFGCELSDANAQAPAIVHGDWHPGNMIYRDRHIVAACDFDNTRSGSRPREISQALIHFSLKAPSPGQTAMTCDPSPALDALAAFWRGYRDQPGPTCPAKLCLGLMPAVMIDEALALLPTDGMADQSALEQSMSMLTAVARKAAWLDEHQSQLLASLESA
tara:strand:- start:94110 stop:95144 length:1035 start_codon:yes stop_codon:yes gene_type:complete